MRAMQHSNKEPGCPLGLFQSPFRSPSLPPSLLLFPVLCLGSEPVQFQPTYAHGAWMHVPVLFTRIKRAGGGRCKQRRRRALEGGRRERHMSVTEQKNTDGRGCAGSPGQPEPLLRAREADRAARAGRHMGTGQWHMPRRRQMSRQAEKYQAGNEGPGQEELQRHVVGGSSRRCCAGYVSRCVPQPLFPGEGVSSWMSLAFSLFSPLWLDPDHR